MSLVLAISNCNGIAISADRRVTQDPVGDRSALLLTDNERKLFVTKSGHAIANVGSHVLKSMKSSSSLIKDTIEQMTPDMALSDELLTLKQAFTENAFDDAYIILIGAIGLIIAACIPIVASGVAGANVSFGGTSIIIIVGVILETITTVKSMMTERKYQNVKGIF